MSTVEITPNPECRVCRGLGLVRGDFVPMPFGSGATRLPDDYCDCVYEEYDLLVDSGAIGMTYNCAIEIKLAPEVQARIEHAIAAETESFPNQVKE